MDDCELVYVSFPALLFEIVERRNYLPPMSLSGSPRRPASRGP
jgi:hypothetical protein